MTASRNENQYPVQGFTDLLESLNTKRDQGTLNYNYLPHAPRYYDNISNLNDYISKLNLNKSTLIKCLNALQGEFVALVAEAEKVNKFTAFFKIKVLDADLIQECSAKTAALVQAFEAYENAIILDLDYFQKLQNGEVPNLPQLENNLKTAKTQFDNAIKALPSNAEMKKIGLLMAGIGAAVAATSAILLVLSAIASITAVLTPMGLTGGALSIAGVVTGGGLVGFGMYKFFKRDHTTGLEQLKSVDQVVCNGMNHLKKYIDERAYQIKP